MSNAEDTIKLLEWALRERNDLKQVAEQVTEQVATVNDIVVRAMTELGIRSYAGEFGILTYRVESTTNNLNKTKLKAAMLNAGLSGDKVAAIIAEATDTRPRAASVDFRRKEDADGKVPQGTE